MARHHTVQEKYLTQWKKADNDNQLSIYSIAENKYFERGPNWKGFWREDFNILDDKDHFYLPEDVTALIDSKGIEVIRNIDCDTHEQLCGEKRSALAFYIALQYIRTPRHREETNKLIQATISRFMREDTKSPADIRLSKDELLKHIPTNQNEKEALQKISTMSDEEIKQATFDAIHIDGLRAQLTKSGHSKSILKIERHAKGLFESQWLFLVAPEDTRFVTSDSPCFTIAPTEILNGLLSPQAIVFFPLRPDLCISISPAIKSKTEHFLKIDKKRVRDINRMTLAYSYRCLIAKDKKQG